VVRYPTIAALFWPQTHMWRSCSEQEELEWRREESRGRGWSNRWNLESLYRESSDIEGPEKSSHVIAWSHFESIADRIGRISVSVLTFPLYAAFSFVFYIDFTTK